MASQINADEPRESRKRKMILCTLKARMPKKGRVFMHSRHSIQELLGPEEASEWTTNSATPARIPDHAYEMMKKALNKVSDMVEGMDGNEIPRSRLDEQLKKLVDEAYPSKEDPVIRVLSDQYFMIVTNLTASLFERLGIVIIEDNHSEDERDGQDNIIGQGNTMENAEDDDQGNRNEPSNQESMSGHEMQDNINGNGNGSQENMNENAGEEGSLNETPLSP